MEAISRLYNSHKTKKKFKRLWTDYVQMALEPRSEGYYSTAVSRVHTLLSIVAIIRSTEPDFSVVSDDTAVDATGHFDVTVYLLGQLAREETFSQREDQQSVALHDTFRRLLTMLTQCLQDERYLARLRLSEDSVSAAVGLGSVVAHCGPEELLAVLRVQVFVCSHHESRRRDETVAEGASLVDEEPVDHCKAARGQLLETVLNSVQMLKCHSERGTEMSPVHDRGVTAEAHTTAVSKLLRIVSKLLHYTGAWSEQGDASAPTSTGPSPGGLVAAQSSHDSPDSAADKADTGAASNGGDDEPFADEESLCRACVFRAQGIAISLGDQCGEEGAAAGGIHAGPVLLSRLEKHRASVLSHIEDMHRVSQRFADEVETALNSTLHTSDKSFEYRLVCAFVALLNVISSVENSAQAMGSMAELFRRSAGSSMCFVLLDGHAALVAMLCRSYRLHDEMPANVIRPPVDVTYSPCGTMKLSPDGYINTSARPREKSPGHIPDAAGRDAAAEGLLVGLMQLLSSLSNCQFPLCSCVPRDLNEALFDDEAQLLLLPVSRTLSDAHKTEILSVFSSSNTSIHHAQLLLILILSGRPLLVRIGAQLCYDLMQCNALNIVALELSGCVTALMAVVKSLVGDTPHLCRVARDAPWLLQLGRSTAFDCTPPTPSLPRYGYGRAVTGTVAPIRTDVSSDEQQEHYTAALLQEALTHCLQTLSFVSILSAQRPNNCVVLSLLTSMVHMAATKKFYSPTNLEAVASSAPADAVEGEAPPHYFYQRGGLHPVSHSVPSGTAGSHEHVRVLCQLCKESVATVECLSVSCAKRDAWLTCHRCRPVHCIVQHAAVRACSAESSRQSANTQWRCRVVSSETGQRRLEFISQAVLEAIKNNPELEHVLISEESLFEPPAEACEWYQLKTSVSNNTNVVRPFMCAVQEESLKSLFTAPQARKTKDDSLAAASDRHFDLIIIVLGAVKAMMDDVSSRNIKVLNALQVLLLDTLKRALFSPGVVPNMAVSVVARMLLDHPAGDVFRCVLSGSECGDVSSETEPPCSNHYSGQRVLMMLLVQCVSRFLTSDRVLDRAVALEVDPHESGSLQRCFLTRADMANRLSDFLTMGGPALLAGIVVGTSIREGDSGNRVDRHGVAVLGGISASDQQFALWSLREALVSALSLGAGEIVGPLTNWLVWLLRCPVADSNRFVLDEFAPALVGNARDDDNTEARDAVMEPPTTLPDVSSASHYLILQEIRVLLSGDTVWTRNPAVAHMRAKILLLDDNEKLSSTGGGISPTILTPASISTLPGVVSSSTVLFSVQPSSNLAQDALISFNAVEHLLNSLIGDGAHPVIQYLFEGGLSEGSPEKGGTYTPSSAYDAESITEEVLNFPNSKLTNYDIIGWWSALGCLLRLISGHSVAKHAIECCVGADRLVGLLLPVVECLGNCSLSDLVMSLIAEMCLNTSGRCDQGSVSYNSVVEIPAVEKIMITCLDSEIFPVTVGELSAECLKEFCVKSKALTGIACKPNSSSPRTPTSLDSRIVSAQTIARVECKYCCSQAARVFIQEAMRPQPFPIYSKQQCTEGLSADERKLAVEHASDTGSISSAAQQYTGRLSFPSSSPAPPDLGGVRSVHRSRRSESFASIVGALSTHSGDPLDYSDHSAGDRASSSYQSIQGLLSALNIKTAAGANQAARAVSATHINDFEEFRTSMDAIQSTEDVVIYSEGNREISVDGDIDSIEFLEPESASAALFSSASALSRYHDLSMMYRKGEVGERLLEASFEVEYSVFSVHRPPIENVEHILLSILQQEIVKRTQLFGGPEMWRLCLARVADIARLSRPRVVAEGPNIGAGPGNPPVESPSNSFATRHRVQPNNAAVKLSWEAIFSNRDVYRRGSVDFLRCLIAKNAIHALCDSEMFRVTHVLNVPADLNAIAGQSEHSRLSNGKAHFISVQSCELLLSCQLSLSEHYSVHLLSLILRLVQDNPLNAEIIVESNILLLLAKLLLFPNIVVETSSCFQNPVIRGRLIQLLSQLLNHSTSAEIVDLIIGSINQGNRDFPCDKKLSPAVELFKDDCSRQAFYILGRTVEKRTPKCFHSFSGGDLFSNTLSLDLVAPTAQLPKLRTGITVSGWVKLPRVTSASPSTKTLFQLCLDDKNDIVRSESEKKGDIKVHLADGVDVFFRVIPEESFTDMLFNPADPGSFLKCKEKGSPTMASSQPKYLFQLCISFRKVLAKDTQSGDTTDPLDTTSGASGDFFPEVLQKAFVRRSVPDVVLDYEWSGKLEWTHIAVSFTDPADQNGLMCWVNGTSAPLLHWTPLGYVPSQSLKPFETFSSKPPAAIKEQANCLPAIIYSLDLSRPLQFLSLGGSRLELPEYENCWRRAEEWVLNCRSGEYTDSVAVDHRNRIGIEVLDSFSRAHVGFSGLVCDFYLLSGIPSNQYLKTYVVAGPAGVPSSMTPGQNNTSGRRFTDVHGLRVLAMVNTKPTTIKTATITLKSMDSTFQTSTQYKIGRFEAQSYRPTSSEPIVLVHRSEYYSRSRSRGDDRNLSTNSQLSLPLDCGDSSGSQATGSTSLVYELFGLFTSQAKAPAATLPAPINIPENTAVDAVKKSVALYSIYDHLYTQLNMKYGLVSKRGHLLPAADMFTFFTKNVADSLPQLKGLKIFFARLCTERRFQVASMRILVALMSTSPGLYQEFLDTQVDKLVLFCMCRRSKSLEPCNTATEVLQILFDFVVADNYGLQTGDLPHGADLAAISAGPGFGGLDCIQRLPILSILVDIACANPTKPKLARCVIDWLRAVCEDNMENISKVLQTFGLSPFLILMSVWSIINCEILIDGGIAPVSDGAAATRSSKRTGRSRLQSKDTDNSESSLGDEDSSLRQLPKREYYRLQLSTARFMKQLITGSFGEYNGASVPAQVTTPTGFSVSHLVKLLQFIVRAGAGRRKGDQGGISRLGAISPGLLLNRGDGETRPEGVGAGYTWSTQQRAQQQTDADGDVVPLTWLSHAAQLGLEVIIDVVDSPLSSNFSHMLKLALPGNDFTSVILELMGSSNVSIKVAAINLLSLYLCGPDGQINTKQVTQFEKVGGFHSMSNLLCSFSSSDSVGNRPRHDDFSEDDVSASVIQDLLEALLSLLFWRKRRKYEANLTAAVAGITLPSTTHPFTGESRMSPAKGKYIDESKRLSMHENCSKLMTVVAGYGVSRRESDYADELDSVGTYETGTTATTLIAAGGFHRNASTDLDDDGVMPDRPTVPRSYFGECSSPLVSDSSKRFNPVPVGPSTGIDGGIVTPPQLSDGVPPKVATDGVISETKLSQSTNPSGGLLSLFGWSGASTPVEGENTAGDPLNIKSSARPRHPQSATTQIEPTRETIVLPQILESIVRILRISNHPNVVRTTFNVLGASLSSETTKIADTTGSGADPAGTRDEDILNRNVEAICSQRDWLLWLCDMYLTIQRRCRQGTLCGGSGHMGNAVTSMSESESSVGGGYDSDDSVELRGMAPAVTRRGSTRDRGRSLSPSAANRRNRSNTGVEKPKPQQVTASTLCPSISETAPAIGSATVASAFMANKSIMLEAYLEPIFAFSQQVFLHDLRCKPLATRKIIDIINRIPIDNPEARQFQMNLLFDVLDAASVETFADADKSMNVLRNISNLLEQAAEKVDIEIEFCVRAVDTMDSLSYNCPTVLRSKIKETSLPEMRVLYVTRVLIDCTADIETKTASIRDIHGSIVSMVTSSEGKSLQDAQVLSILLGIWTEASEEIERNTDLLDDPLPGVASSEPHLSRSLDRAAGSGRKSSVGGVSQGTSLAALESAAAMEAEAVNMSRQDAIERSTMLKEVQLVVLELMQDIVNASAECKKYVAKLCGSLDAAVASLENHRGFVSVVSLPHGFSRGDVFQTAICNRYETDSLTMSDLNTLNRLGSVAPPTESGSVSSLGKQNLLNSTDSSSPDGPSYIRMNLSPSGGTAENTSGGSWWGSWVGSGAAVTSIHSPALLPTSVHSATSRSSTTSRTSRVSSDASMPPLELPPTSATLRTGSGNGDFSGNGLLSQILTPDKPDNVVPHVDNAALVEWYSKPSNRELRCEINSRVMRDLKPIIRQSEKIQERVVQRRSRSVRYNLERLTKEKSTLLKSAKDCIEKSHQVNNKFSSTCGRDSEHFLNDLLSRIVVGEGMSWSHDGGDTPSADMESRDLKKPKSTRSGSNDHSSDVVGDESAMQSAKRFLSTLKNFHEHRKQSLASNSAGGKSSTGGFKSIGGSDFKSGDCA